MRDSEDALIAAARAGDAQALDTLLTRHLPAVHAFVRLRAGALIRAKESSADIVQSVCREVLRGIDNFRHGGDDAFRQWLFTTVVRKLSDRDDRYRALRRDAGREAAGVARSTGGDRSLLDAYATLATPSKEAIAREEVERIESAFADLPDEYREVITLARIVRLPHADIARAMGKSEGAVRKLLFRALRVLAERLDPDA
jgi:RNA polymerase sigma-70 factor, ECF subfamily